MLRKDPYGKPVDVWACGRTAFNVPFNSPNSLTQHVGPEVIKKFSCSTQLSMKFEMLLKYKNIKKLSIFQVQISLECHFSGS